MVTSDSGGTAPETRAHGFLGRSFCNAEPVVYRGAYEYGVSDRAEDFVPQHLAPEQVASGER